MISNSFQTTDHFFLLVLASFASIPISSISSSLSTSSISITILAFVGLEISGKKNNPYKLFLKMQKQLQVYIYIKRMSVTPTNMSHVNILVLFVIIMLSLFNDLISIINFKMHSQLIKRKKNN